MVMVSPYEAVTVPLAHTATQKAAVVLLLLNPLCAGLHQKQKTTIWTALAHDGSPASGATCAFLILGFCSGEFERIKLLMFQ